MTISDHEAWYALRAYNSQTVYGWGTAAEADRYADRLNELREINVYGARLMTAEEIALVPYIEDEGINLGDAFAASEGVQ